MKMKELQSDVVIIGAGIVGTALAYELSHYELSVVVVEKEADVGWGATKANSGIIHAAVHNPPSTLKGKLCFEGNRLYRQFESELGIQLRSTGMLMVAEKEEQLGQLEKIRK
ncbi:MAG TPA: FAD/NAD(P)-binding oxidoreductase, partial [Firmicutes bacterium]|nr:FAD/NAD(P)-binding oxidoreductase [Bacillota bacterium]